MRVVGYTDVNGRPPFKLAIQEVGGRWYLYTGHLWHRGWSILDVTDPSQPSVVRFIPGPENTWTIQMEVDEGTMITALEQMPESWGGDPNQPFEEGVLVWSLADPTNPELLGHFRTGGTGTHRNFYAGGRYVHLAAGMPGYSGEIYVILDISDPTRPVEAGRWWVPGQHEAGGETPEPGVSLHGPPYVEGNLAYLSYGAAGVVILDISDVSAPRMVGQLDFSPPFLANIGLHSVLPLPVPSRKSPYRDFCEKGGRFGPYNINPHFHSEFVERRDDRVYLTYFNAGLRIYDIENPRVPKEIGYFIPPDPTQRFGPQPPDRLVVQTEDVLVDRRGYIYITNKNQGLWILRYTGRPALDSRP
ncbi:MAG TPA: hypothetical protein VF406_12745 [Thermodesulfobacteriota bacterium]